MITVFDVYLSMQLDSIRVFTALLGLVLVSISLRSACEINGFNFMGLIVLALAALLGMITAFLPSNQTAAAMLEKEALRGSVQSQQGAMVEKEAVSK